MKKHTLATPYIVGDVHFYEFWLNQKHILVDTGPPSRQASQYISTEIDLASLDLVLITHCHHDHFGQLRFLCENTKARVLMPEIDHLLFINHKKRATFFVNLLIAHGFPSALMDKLKQSYTSYDKLIPHPHNYELLEEHRSELLEWGIDFISCPGHSQSDIIFFIAEFAVTGDTLLRDIFQTPLLDLDPRTENSRFSNYMAYCDSLPKFQRAKGYQVLPSHHDTIDGVDRQILFYTRKLVERSKLIEQIHQQRNNLFENICHLFPDVLDDPFKLFIKTSEVFFLIDYLDNPGLLTSSLEKIGLAKL